MEPKISVNFMFLDTTKEIWDHAKKLYSGQDNKTRVYQLYQEYFNLKQGSQSLEEYYASLRNIRNELNVYHPLTSEVQIQRQQREQLDVTRFLVGLKAEYEPVRAQIWEDLLFPHLKKFLLILRGHPLSR